MKARLISLLLAIILGIAVGSLSSLQLTAYADGACPSEPQGSCSGGSWGQCSSVACTMGVCRYCCVWGSGGGGGLESCGAPMSYWCESGYPCNIIE